MHITFTNWQASLQLQCGLSTYSTHIPGEELVALTDRFYSCFSNSMSILLSFVFTRFINPHSIPMVPANSSNISTINSTNISTNSTCHLSACPNLSVWRNEMEMHGGQSYGKEADVDGDEDIEKDPEQVSLVLV